MEKNSKKNQKNDKKKKQRNIMILVGIVILISAFVVIFNNNSTQILKSEYSIGEVGHIDDITIVLDEVTYINNDTGIELTFEITNERSNTITITPDDYFVFYDINQVQIPNKYTNDKNIVKKDETITYKLQYDVTRKELYEIYFYSQVVENNIKFSFKSSDIKSNNIAEENVVTGESLNE